MTDKPKAYNLTPDYFARARADIDRSREQLDAKLAQIDAWESIVIEIVDRYPEVAASPKTTKNAASPAATKGRKARRSNAGKRPNDGEPYTPEQDARIIASVRGERAQLAQELGRPYEGLLKRREILVRQGREAEKTDAPTPDQDGEARRFDESLPQRMEELAVVADIKPSSSENPEIVEPTPAALGKPQSQESDMTNTGFRQPGTEVARRYSEAARELAEFDARRQRMPPAKPGVPVPGLTDDGPGKERYLDPDAFASMRPD